MAYNKQITTSSGYSANYWRLSEWTFSKLRNEVRATFRVYKDSASAADGKNPASEQVAKLQLSGDQYLQFFGEDRDFAKSDQELIYDAATELGVTSDFGSQTGDEGKKELFKDAKKV
jgi:hypothetical protein|tara:strand:+ start:89 stop:439 length:351 start_codon:yes stop_codon:yes gene_type:complete